MGEKEWGAFNGGKVSEQRCWNHRLVNVLDTLPKKLQAEARDLLTKIPYAETRAEAERLKRGFQAWANVVESPFAVVRLRTAAAKRFKTEQCIYLHRFQTLTEARRTIGEFIARYNTAWLKRSGIPTWAAGSALFDGARLTPLGAPGRIGRAARCRSRRPVTT